MARRGSPDRQPSERRRGEFAEEYEVAFQDRPASSPTGRQREPADTRSPDEMPSEDVDADNLRPGEMQPDELWKSTRTTPASAESEDTGETVDGLDETDEAVRREAEEHPPGRRD